MVRISLENANSYENQSDQLNEIYEIINISMKANHAKLWSSKKIENLDEKPKKL